MRKLIKSSKSPSRDKFNNPRKGTFFSPSMEAPSDGELRESMFDARESVMSNSNEPEQTKILDYKGFGVYRWMEDVGGPEDGPIIQSGIYVVDPDGEAINLESTPYSWPDDSRGFGSEVESEMKSAIDKMIVEGYYVENDSGQMPGNWKVADLSSCVRASTWDPDARGGQGGFKFNIEDKIVELDSRLDWVMSKFDYDDRVNPECRSYQATSIAIDHANNFIQMMRSEENKDLTFVTRNAVQWVEKAEALVRSCIKQGEELGYAEDGFSD